MGFGIKVRKLVPDLKAIDSAYEGEWIDLRASQDIELEAFEYMKIPLGVAMSLPDGYEAIVAARSSTYQKWGIIPANGIGIIDNAYKADNDEWKLPVIALRKTKIHKNDRICQFRIQKKQPDVCLLYTGSLGNPDRGGFGSTGSE
jgi:dUTP pyrophosphatase